MMTNVYENCPQFENGRYLLRLIDKSDLSDLLKVYSDRKAVPLFNSDNCNGDDFYYSTAEKMSKAIDFWIFSYKEGYFVRWTIVDKKNSCAVGTIELFHRDADDYFDNTGVLRLDLRSDYECADSIGDILGLIIPPSFDLFYCDKIITKASDIAVERMAALSEFGFKPSEQKFLGRDGAEYGDYWVIESKK